MLRRAGWIRDVAGTTPGTLHAAAEDEELLAQQGVLGDQLGRAAGEIGQRPGEDCRCGRLRGSHEAATQRMEDGVTGAGDAVQEASEHGWLPIKHYHGPDMGR